MFGFLGVPALLGRGIMPSDADPSAPPVFVMAHKMWKKRFGLDPSIFGNVFTINGRPTTLVGIMPPRFTKRAADFWIVTSMDPADAGNQSHCFQFQARLKPGVTLPQVNADIDVIARRMAVLYPQEYPKQFTIQTVTW